jgi:hypothetical protein
MADFSGIGAFGEGALQGYDKSLSRYATISEIAQRRIAEQRARQAQELQTLLHGTQLSQTNPDVAERAALEPDRYGLSPETVGPGVAQARGDQAAKARLNQALISGDLDALNDPAVSRFITKDHLGTIQEMQMRRKVDAIIAGPGTAQEKAQMLMRIGANPPAGLLEAGYPELGGAKAEHTAAGTARGQLPLAESLSRAKAVGQASGELQFAGPLAGAKRSGEIGAELGADPATNVPPGGTAIRRLATERETPSDRERKLRGGINIQIGPKDISASQARVQNMARQDVSSQLSQAAKQMNEFTPAEQAQIREYLIATRARALAEQDPVLQGQQYPEIPRPPIMDTFEGKLQGGDYWQSIKEFFMGAAPAAATVAAPRSLRNPSPNAPAPANTGWGKSTVVR